MTRTRLVVGAGIAGLVVLTIALALQALAPADTARVIGFQRTGDTRKIVVIVSASILDELRERHVRETGDAVEVTVRVRHTTGTVPSVTVFLPFTLVLRHPLGDRRVLDDRGEPVRDLGTYEPPR